MKRRLINCRKAVRETNERYQEILLLTAEEVTARRYISELHLLSFNTPFREKER